MINHEVSDLVARLKNSSLAKNDTFSVPFSKVRVEILNILKEHGFIFDCREVKNKSGVKSLLVYLKYYDSKSVIRDISVISKPGKRIYCSAATLPVVRNGLGFAIISTTSGLVTSHMAKTKNIGGEVLLQIF